MNMAFSSNDNFAIEDNGNADEESRCRRCNKFSELMCLRCGDCYCSKKCQNLEWPKHRYICFPKPPLVKINNKNYNDEDVPEHGMIEPVHLKEQLRIMANVCRDFMEKLETLTDFKTDNINKHFVNGNKSYDDADTVSDEQSYINNKHMKRNNNNYNNNKANIRPISSTDPFDICSISSNKSDLQNQDIIEDQIVYLTCFRSSNRVGVCPQKYEKDGSYRKILNKIDNYGRNAPALNKVIKTNEFVIALRGRKYARAKILSQKENINKSRVRLDFLDYGNLAYRKITDLREITTEIINLPIYTKIVQLNQVDLFNYDDNILRFLSSFENKFYKLKNIGTGGSTTTNSISVELYDLESDKKINELISNFCTEHDPTLSSSSGQMNKLRNKNVQKQKCTNEFESSLINQDSFNEISKYEIRDSKNSFNEINHSTNNNTELEPILTAPFKEHIFPSNTRNKNAIVLDVSLVDHGYLACILEEHKLILNEIKTYLDKCDKSHSPYKPKYGEYVIAKFEGDWYRGKVIGVLPNNKFEISYIDFLNEETLTSEEICRYPEELKIDCYTTLCVISRLPKVISPKIKEFLKTEINFNDIIKINRIAEITDGRVACIECDEIVNRMIDNNLM